MRKHAYLVMAHNNYKVLEKCLLLLDAPYNDFYIHIDKKAEGFPIVHFQNLLTNSTVHIYQEMEVNWAGYSQVQCELFLLEQASGGQYGFYHLLSGADMPVRSAEDIYLFFERHRDKLFVSVQPYKLQSYYRKYRNRISKYHPFQEYRFKSNKKVVRNILTFVCKAMLAVQIICRVDRIKGTEIYYGSQWFSIPHGFAVYLIEHKGQMERLFKWTQCPDEHAIQMMAMASPFRELLYRDEEAGYSNMRYIRWRNEGDPHPVILRKEDVDHILESRMCFARKFDEKVDCEAVEEIYSRLKGMQDRDEQQDLCGCGNLQ